MNRAVVFILGMLTGVIVTCITGMIVGASIFFFSGSEEVVYADTPTEVVLEDDSDGSALPAKGVVIDKSITSDKRFSFFPEMGECISYRSFQVDKVLDNGAAIAYEEHLKSKDYYSSTSLTVVFVNNQGKNYYDKEIIKVPTGQCVRQVGIYKQKRYSDVETFPVVMLVGK